MSEKKQSGWKRLKEKYTTIEAIDEKIRQATKKGRSAMYLKILGYLKTSLLKEQGVEVPVPKERKVKKEKPVVQVEPSKKEKVDATDIIQ